MGGKSIKVNLICFGPLAEELGFRESIIMINENLTPKDIIIQLNAEKWIEAGIKIALNGEFINLNHVITQNCEIAMLPPVSGG